MQLPLSDRCVVAFIAWSIAELVRRWRCLERRERYRCQVKFGAAYDPDIDKDTSMRIAIIGNRLRRPRNRSLSAHRTGTSLASTNGRTRSQEPQQGIVPIYEPGLEIRAGQQDDSFHNKPGRRVNGAEIIVIAVGTPTRKLDGNARPAIHFAAARRSTRRWTSTR